MNHPDVALAFVAIGITAWFVVVFRRLREERLFLAHFALTNESFKRMNEAMTEMQFGLLEVIAAHKQFGVAIRETRDSLR